MIFQHTISKVLDGSKCQTARLVKPGDSWASWLEYGVIGRDAGKFIELVPNSRPAHGVNNISSVYRSSGSLAYRLLKTYAVQPGRGKPAVARIRIESIARQDVRTYTHEDAVREGFENKVAFMVTYMGMHDPTAMPTYRDYDFPIGASSPATKFLASRPAERYDCWVLRFSLVEDAK